MFYGDNMVVSVRPERTHHVCPFIHAVAEADTSECPAPVLNLTIRVHIQISVHIQIFRVDVSILGMEMMDCTLTAEYFDGHHRVDPLPPHVRSEEHTSELQSRFDLVCRLLL